jgi:hypothetical protein
MACLEDLTSDVLAIVLLATFGRLLFSRCLYGHLRLSSRTMKERVDEAQTALFLQSLPFINISLGLVNWDEFNSFLVCRPNLTSIIIRGISVQFCLSRLFACQELRILILNQFHVLTSLLPLTSFLHLSTLHLSPCYGAMDLLSIALCTSLCELVLQGAPQDLCLLGLASLTNLSTLSLTCSHESNLGGMFVMVDLAPLASLSNLSSLVLRRVPSLFDISALAHCQALTSIVIDGANALVDICALANCTCLQILYLCGMSISSLSSLPSCVLLQCLRFVGGRNITDISPLSCCSQLTRLQLSGMHRIQSLDGLRPCFSLWSVVFVNMHNLDDIRFLYDCPHLMSAAFMNCRSLSDITPLKKCFRVTLRECMNVIDQEGCS